VDNTLNYLDISIHRTPTKWKTSIYRKPTFTDTINPLHIQSPHTKQICGNQISIQQTKLLWFTQGKISTRREHNPQHPLH